MHVGDVVPLIGIQIRHRNLFVQILPGDGAANDALIAVWQPPGDPLEPVAPFAAPDRIAAIVGIDRAAALSILGA